MNTRFIYHAHDSFRSLGVIAQYIDSDDKNDLVRDFVGPSKQRNPYAEQRSFQALLPAMIQVIGQTVEAGNEAGARQLFDVFETLLILVSSLHCFQSFPNKNVGNTPSGPTRPPIRTIPYPVRWKHSL
jgi:hypothetical protein